MPEGRGSVYKLTEKQFGAKYFPCSLTIWTPLKVFRIPLDLREWFFFLKFFEQQIIIFSPQN